MHLIQAINTEARMPPRKRKIQESEEIENPISQTRYVAGKQPRNQSKLPVVDYHKPLDPDSELTLDEDWSIPKFNLFITFTLDNLIESYRAIFKDFIKLPSRKFHPGYFYKIDQPISINEIKSRDYEYPNGYKNFLLDIELVTKNCSSYNDEDSLIVKNSMQAVNYVKYEVLKAKNITRNYLISDSVKEKLLKYLDKVTNATEKSIAESAGENTDGLDNTVKLAEPFAELVDKDELPEYYEVIHRPNALKLVRNNLEMRYYTKIYDFYIDVELIFQNALVFNDSETLIYQDAEKLLKFFRREIYNNFFTELKNENEKGEIKLEYDKVEYEQYLANGGDNEGEGSEDDEADVDDYDFNHYEGLGNGYNRTLFSGDYLLGPNHGKADGLAYKRTKTEVVEDESDTLKFNILKALTRYNKEEELDHGEVFALIHDISISSAKSVYRQATKPLQGTLPSINQTWVEFLFKGKNMKKGENMYVVTMPPVQASISFLAHLNCPPQMNYQTSLMVNKEKANPSPSMSSNENLVPSRYEIRLPEGLNYLEYTCQDLDSDRIEVVKFWVDVLP